MIGLPDWVEKLKKAEKDRTPVGTNFSLKTVKAGREVTALYMGGQRWQIKLKRPS